MNMYYICISCSLIKRNDLTMYIICVYIFEWAFVLLNSRAEPELVIYIMYTTSYRIYLIYFHIIIIFK